MTSAAILEAVWRKKMDLTAKGKAALVHAEHGNKQVFISYSRTAQEIERVRWEIVEQRRRFLRDEWDVLYTALSKACPASAEIKGIKGWSNGVITYHRSEDGAISFQWEDAAPRKQKIVIAFVLAERRLAQLNSRLLVWDDVLSWKMFPEHGLEYGGCQGLTRYVVNGRSYIAQRTRHGYHKDKKAEMFVYTKFSYPGWDTDDVYREIRL